MAFKSWNSFWVFARKTKHDHRYIHDSEISEFLDEVIMTSEGRIRKIKNGKIFWRAQLGNEWRPIIQNGEEVAKEPVPHSRKRMKPIPFIASEGRANPKGIPYLYLATDEETAMSEVRPWLGEYISVGQFEVSKALSLIDCSMHENKCTTFYLEEPDEHERELAVWAHIDKAFSKPIVPSDDLADYVPTQIISELFKSNGFDGMAYKSSLSNGLNIVLFDPIIADIVNCFVYELEEVTYRFEQAANPYFVRK